MGWVGGILRNCEMVEAKHTAKVDEIGRYSYQVICVFRILPPAVFRNPEIKVREALARVDKETLK